MSSPSLSLGDDISIKRNNSNIQLVCNDSDKVTGPEIKMTPVKWQAMTVAVLCLVNLINYMDRFTIAGVLDDVQRYYDIKDDETGLLQTVFIMSYMIFAPLFGYLGDRYNRKFIMALGVFLWSLTTLLGSFMTQFGLFIFFRTLVGIGEASYSTIAPTIISDMFKGDERSKILALFYFSIPVGSGLGYIIGSETAKSLGEWQWALRVTPFLGLLAVVLILFCSVDPPRGAADGASLHATSWKSDMRHICTNPTFMLSTLGFTCVCFVAGALAWWGPHFIKLGLKVQGQPESAENVSFIFGIVSMVSGLAGVPLGSSVASQWRKKFVKADPIVCALGLFISAPFLCLTIVLAKFNTPATYAVAFFAEFFLNLNWAILADILLYVIIPTRRSSAEAFQILVSHAFGDAGSPYLIGQISEFLKNSTTNVRVYDVPGNSTVDPALLDNFTSLQYAVVVCVFVEILGGILFLISAAYLVKDKAKATRVMLGGCSVDVLVSSPETSNNRNSEDASCLLNSNEPLPT